jgi:hypothetical protein
MDLEKQPAEHLLLEGKPTAAFFERAYQPTDERQLI